MSRPDGSASGATTAAAGTPYPVDFGRDRRARRSWVMLLGGPVLLITHFMLVYLVAEAGCTGEGPGLDVFDPPVPRTLTLVATAVSAALCVPMALWALRRHRAAGESGSLAFVALLLALVSLVSILLVGVPAAFLGEC